MSRREGEALSKSEIAKSLGVSTQDVSRWTDAFSEYLDVDARWIGKAHDEDDVTIFRLIRAADAQIPADVSFRERKALIGRALGASRIAGSVKHRRTIDRARPEVERWQLVSSLGMSLRREYGWLRPLRHSVERIADFGCWASVGGTCAEPYALLWTLEAAMVVVVEKESGYLRNARDWLAQTRRRRPYFAGYQLRFVVADMTQGPLDEGAFDLSYCRDVLYNMQDSRERLQSAVDEMARAVRKGGWVVAVEPKVGAQFEEVATEFRGAKLSAPLQVTGPVDIGHHFQAAGLLRATSLACPRWSYCYTKPVR